MSFQNRLAHYQDKRNARLVRNDITRSGMYVDAIHVTSYRDSQYDERRLAIDSFQFLPVVFPFDQLEGMETRIGTTPEGKRVTHLMAEQEHLQVFADIRRHFLDKDDMLFWMIENYAGVRGEAIEPAILLLKVTNMLSHFGSYGITFQGYMCTTSDPSTLPEALTTALAEAYEKRRPEILATHARTQIE